MLSVVGKNFNKLLAWADEQSWKRLATVIAGSMFLIWVIPSFLSDLFFLAIIAFFLYGKFNGSKAQKD